MEKSRTRRKRRVWKIWMCRFEHSTSGLGLSQHLMSEAFTLDGIRLRHSVTFLDVYITCAVQEHAWGQV
jgi:hypothetical protein